VGWFRLQYEVLLRRQESSSAVWTGLSRAARLTRVPSQEQFADNGWPATHAMIDALSLLISHGVILLAAWRLLSRPDLDRDPSDPRAEDGDA